MITNFKLFENKRKIFHCYIPFFNENTKEYIFLCLNKININKSIKDDIIEYFKDEEDEYFQQFEGFFLRFYDDIWDFYEVDKYYKGYAITKKNIIDLSEKIEDTSYNEGNVKSHFTAEGKPTKKSIYIGEITLTPEEIEFHKNIKKYNL
jgi:hypothetical protein